MDRDNHSSRRSYTEDLIDKVQMFSCSRLMFAGQRLPSIHFSTNFLAFGSMKNASASEDQVVVSFDAAVRP